MLWVQFMVKQGELLTPHGDWQVLRLAAKEGIRTKERHISLSEFHAAEEVIDKDY